MRIISGDLKGKSINFIKNSKTRPLKDSVKENIFNVITHSKIVNINFKKSQILDLYSGVGSFGIECLSRGAQKVTFVENDKTAVKILRDNLINLSVLNKTDVHNGDVEQILSQNLKKNLYIFFDPPFLDKSFPKIYTLLKNLRCIKKNILWLFIEKRNQ